jgi:outer membrane protein OmpA-like peptidoglycan-associated protein
VSKKFARHLALAAIAIASTVAADAPEVVTFIGCPIYRDTDLGRKSGCWLAEDPATGIRYDVTDAPTKPQVGRMSLFEGVVTKDADTCGGIVLRPVRSAVLSDDTCPKVIVPAEQYSGRRFVLPDEVLKPTWEPRALPAPPYATKEFHIVFDYGNDFLIYQYAELILEKVSLYVKASQPKTVVVTGFAATKPLQVSARSIVEPMTLAKSRAEATAEALARLGVDRRLIRIETRGDPATLSSLATPGLEASKRRVTIRIEI